jgi:hypothetical protein
MKTVLAFALAAVSLVLLAGCPDNSPKPGTTPAASGSAATPAATGAASAGSGW